MRLYGAILTVLSIKSVAAGCCWLLRDFSSPFLIVTSIEVIALSISYDGYWDH